MCLHPSPIDPVPEQTARVARAAFRKGNLYLQMRDELGTLYTDADFVALYPRRGQPAEAPWRLALITVMQFVENLSDRQAADAVRARIDWKYALSLELTDEGFDFSVLCKFRERLIAGDAEQLLLDRMLDHFKEKSLLKARGQQRTDSTHVLAAIRVMNRLELVTETMRAALNDLASVAPEWLRSVSPTDWHTRYDLRAEQTRFPKGDKARQEYAETVGRDGFLLLTLLEQRPDLSTRERVKTLRQVWERHYARSETGALSWRNEADLSRAATALESPYDTQARHSNKHALSWTGYKVHVSETCDADLPHLITHVHSTVATTQDVSCTHDIQQGLADKALLPARHLVDAGYVDADLLVQSKEQHDVELFGPPRGAQGWQVREGGYDQSQFRVDWEKEQVVCPEGNVSRMWHLEDPPEGSPLARVRFGRHDCAACPSRARCVRSTRGNPRTLGFPPRPMYEALHQAREHLSSDAGAQVYKTRAGVEGTLSQGVRRSDLRHRRYRELKKTHLQHLATAAALNVVRTVVHLAGNPVAQTRVSRFARLAA